VLWYEGFACDVFRAPCLEHLCLRFQHNKKFGSTRITQAFFRNVHYPQLISFTLVDINGSNDSKRHWGPLEFSGLVRFIRTHDTSLRNLRLPNEWETSSKIAEALIPESCFGFAFRTLKCHASLFFELVTRLGVKARIRNLGVSWDSLSIPRGLQMSSANHHLRSWTVSVCVLRLSVDFKRLDAFDGMLDLFPNVELLYLDLSRGVG
jgi:hypothetical protein